MWLGKFLDLEDDINELRNKLKKEIFKNIEKNKITPLEFTILEIMFNNKELSGYDLILKLNKHFAGTWTAQSGTVYPILSKLKKEGFLKFRTVKSPIGPKRKVYSLTEGGEQILKTKVNKHFADQLKFIENFLIDLSSVYVQSFPKSEKRKRIEESESLLKQTIQNAIINIPLSLEIKTRCSKCGAEISRQAIFCPKCGASLI